MQETTGFFPCEQAFIFDQPGRSSDYSSPEGKGSSRFFSLGCSEDTGMTRIFFVRPLAEQKEDTMDFFQTRF